MIEGAAASSRASSNLGMQHTLSGADVFLNEYAFPTHSLPHTPLLNPCQIAPGGSKIAA
jgi:hypothetical protein